MRAGRTQGHARMVMVKRQRTASDSGTGAQADTRAGREEDSDDGDIDDDDVEMTSKRGSLLSEASQAVSSVVSEVAGTGRETSSTSSTSLSSTSTTSTSSSASATATSRTGSTDNHFADLDDCTTTCLTSAYSSNCDSDTCFCGSSAGLGDTYTCLGSSCTSTQQIAFLEQVLQYCTTAEARSLQALASSSSISSTSSSSSSRRGTTSSSSTSSSSSAAASSITTSSSASRSKTSSAAADVTTITTTPSSSATTSRAGLAAQAASAITSTESSGTTSSNSSNDDSSLSKSAQVGIACGALGGLVLLLALIWLVRKTLLARSVRREEMAEQKPDSWVEASMQAMAEKEHEKMAHGSDDGADYGGYGNIENSAGAGAGAGLGTAAASRMHRQHQRQSRSMRESGVVDPFADQVGRYPAMSANDHFSLGQDYLAAYTQSQPASIHQQYYASPQTETRGYAHPAQGSTENHVPAGEFPYSTHPTQCQPDAGPPRLPQKKTSLPPLPPASNHLSRYFEGANPVRSSTVPRSLTAGRESYTFGSAPHTPSRKVSLPMPMPGSPALEASSFPLPMSPPAQHQCLVLSPHSSMSPDNSRASVMSSFKLPLPGGGPTSSPLTSTPPRSSSAGYLAPLAEGQAGQAPARSSVADLPYMAR